MLPGRQPRTTYIILECRYREAVTFLSVGVIVVQPGEKVPIDGVIVEGSSTLNTSALTGESVVFSIFRLFQNAVFQFPHLYTLLLHMADQ